MKLVLLINNMKFSGGRKLFFEYANYLIESGHDTTVMCCDKRGDLIDFVPATYVKDFTSETIPDCDLIVTMTHREVLKAVQADKAPVIHFCQGFEVTDLEQRLDGEVIPARFQGNGFFNKLKLMKKKRSWKRKLQHFNNVYSQPTHLATVSQHLKEELEKRYKRPVALCRNGIHQQLFFPAEKWIAPQITKERPLKIATVGPHEVSFKGIPTTLKAIEILKAKGIPVTFTRITPRATETDKTHPVIDELYENISQDKLGEILRSQDAYISNSTEGEGFGLPAMEALSCGLLTVLSSIASYVNFDPSSDFCHFVPENDAEATANAIEKIINSTPEELATRRNRALEVASNYSHEKACQRFEEILQNTITSTIAGK